MWISLLKEGEFCVIWVQAHLAPGSETRFDFQKYIGRSLEEDFKVVVGIRLVLSSSKKKKKWIVKIDSFISLQCLIYFLYAVQFCGSLQRYSCSPIHMVSSAALWLYTLVIWTQILHFQQLTCFPSLQFPMIWPEIWSKSNMLMFLFLFTGWFAYLWLPFIPLFVSRMPTLTLKILVTGLWLRSKITMWVVNSADNPVGWG